MNIVDNIPNRSDLSEIRAAGLQQRTHSLYARLIGIEMDQRHLFRQLCEQISESGETSVDQLLSSFRFRVRNELDSAEEVPETSGSAITSCVMSRMRSCSAS